eukprot:gene2950-3682_t
MKNKKQPIKLLTYNVFIRPPGIRNNQNDYKDERLECMISPELKPQKIIRSEIDQEGVPNAVFMVDMKSFPVIPFLSPWRSPRYGGNNGYSSSGNVGSGGYDKPFINYKEYTPLNGSILSQYDIICFQELFSAFSFRQKRFIEKAKKQGFLYSSTSPLPAYFKSTFLVDGGLVVLSKYPIVDSDYFLYTQGVNSDMLASKGALYTKIEIVSKRSSPTGEPQYIHLFTTHLQASYARPQFEQQQQQKTDQQQQHPNVANDGIRAIQINQLRDFIISKCKQDHQTIILAGDLNVDGRSSKTDPTDGKAYLEMLDSLSTCPKTGSKLFNITDYLREDYGGNHPPTVGDIKCNSKEEESTSSGGNGVIARETVLTHTNDYGCMKRLDYILQFDRTDSFLLNFNQQHQKNIKSPNGANSNSPSVDENHLHHHQQKHLQHSSIHQLNSTKIEPFFIKNCPFTQLSDHYGVSTILEFNQK